MTILSPTHPRRIAFRSNPQRVAIRNGLHTLQEFSIPLIAGVVVAMIAANLAPQLYDVLIHTPLPQLGAALVHGSHSHGLHEGVGHYFTLHFLMNDIFMAFFFGLAAKEITEACLPNGALNPPSKAVNPLFATVGGVVGPIAVFVVANLIFGRAEWARGWGIPTATDIALAWLVARLLFGQSHPAVSFLLLLAVADDAIGLGIIAFGYPDPIHPPVWSQLFWLLPGILSTYVLRRRGVTNWYPYVLLGGALCWFGLYSAHLHPALALTFVVPFMPAAKRDAGLYADSPHDSTLDRFEHETKRFIDFGLFGFAFANAGVPLAGINGLTWIVLCSLILGKTVGITGFSLLARSLGFPLPEKMNVTDLVQVGLIAGLGLTVALFVSSQAFTDPGMMGAAKMGAVLSAAAALFAWGCRRIMCSSAETTD